jgi:ABC-type phosphate transport system substrate-binding protein
VHKARPLLVVLVAAFLVSCDGNAAPSGQNTPDSAGSSSIQPASQIWFPEPDQDIGALYGIRALAPDDVWVVGETKVHVVNGASRGHKALVAHWNGTQWTTLATFGDGVNDYVLNDIAVISANDVWAVGKHIHPQGTTVIYEPLAVH